jgi:hypothetical protein
MVTEPVLEALRAMRPPFALYEADLHALVGQTLNENGILYVHEARLAPRCRVDYLVGDVAVEIKKGKPRPADLRAQLLRYAMCDGVRCLVVLSWKSVELPEMIVGKPIYRLAMSQLWGVSLP